MCPKCRTELDVPADWLGESIQCSGCQAEFVARAADRTEPTTGPRSGGGADDQPRRPRRDDEDDHRPRRRRPVRDDDDEDGDRPRRRRRPRTSGGSGKVLLVLGGIGLLILLVCGGGIGWFVVSLNKPVAFAESAWHEHSVPDGGASVQVPITLKFAPTPDPGFGIKAYKDIGEVSGGKDAGFAFAVLDYPGFTQPDLEELYSHERDDTLRRTDSRVVSERSLTVQGCPAKELVFAAGTARGVVRLIYLREQNRHRFFLVMAAGRHLSDTDRTRCIESFKIKSRK